MKLSDKYWEYIYDSARAEFLEGTTAAGKTTTVGVKFIMNVIESDMRLHVIAARTTGVCEKNIINADMGLLDIFPSLVYCGNGDKTNRMPHIKVGSGDDLKIIYILGYDNADTWENVLGSQFGCVWADECNTAHIDFIREVFGRSKYFVGTLNPDNPALEIYKEYVNKSRPLDRYKDDTPLEIQDELYQSEAMDGWRYWFFSFEDNISMTDEDIAAKKASYPKGTKIYKNKVQGLRGVATGLVFSMFSHKRHVRDKKWAKQFIKRDRKQQEYYVIFTAGLDTAYSSQSKDTISMVYHGITNLGRLVQLDERSYNNKGKDVPIAPSDTAKNFNDFLDRNGREWGETKNVYVDSADQGTITELMKYKRQHVSECRYIFNNAHKKLTINDRIVLQQGWMDYDDETGKDTCFYVLDTCKQTIHELEVYSWDEKKDNKPEDGNDHCINACQYSWIPYRTKIFN